MSDNTKSKELPQPKHLTKLPIKSFDVAPGDVIGGMIFVMDKPLGIEEGMVGASVDSPAYRDYIKEQLKQLRTNKHPNTELQNRFNSIKTKVDFLNKDEEGKIDYLIHDKEHKTKFHPFSWKEVGKVFTTVGQLHTIKGLTSYKVNVGTGGLLFEEYKKELKINPSDNFGTEIGKLTKARNKVYMVKQDGELILGGTGPGLGKILKTTTGKKMLQPLLHPLVVLATGGLSAVAFGVGALIWKATYLKNNNPVKTNSDAIVEAVATKMAKARGFKAQEIDIIEGTYQNGAPKFATVVTWTPGCRDLSGRLAGGTNTNSVVVKINETGARIKTEDGLLVSDNSIYGLGESLIGFISAGDRDGIGSMGQNKAIVPLPSLTTPPFTHEFYGIDFGKAYNGKNPIIETLQDNFSFENLKGKTERFTNYSMLYDNPLRDKMKGVYLLAALRGQLTDPKKSEIAKEYDTTDTVFAAKLRKYPDNGINSDLELIKSEIAKYKALALENQQSKKETEYNSYANRLEDVLKTARDNDNLILKTFEERLKNTPSEIDLLDNIEKLTAKKAYSTSPDGKVQLNHIRVKRKDRTPWQLKKLADGSYLLSCKADPKYHPKVLNKLSAFEAADKNSEFKQYIIDPNTNTSTNNKIEFTLTADNVKNLSAILTEQAVADHRELKLLANNQAVVAEPKKTKPAFNKKLLCKTTGWHNNCGLNCLTHFLISKMESGDLQNKFGDDNEYKILLETFKEYYKLDTDPTWDDIKKLLTDLPTPHDREAIFSPVLRQYLGKKIISNNTKENWESGDATMALSDYLQNGQVQDVAEPIFKSNKATFDRLKKDYDIAMRDVDKQPFTEDEKAEAKKQLERAENERTKINEDEKKEILPKDIDKPFTEEEKAEAKQRAEDERTKNINAKIKFNRKLAIQDKPLAEWENFWMSENGGCQKYADRIANLKKSEMVSIAHLQLISKSLGIETEVYTPRYPVVDEAKTENNWLMRVYNGGVHWEYEEPNLDPKEQKKHNSYYSVFSSGKFSTYLPFVSNSDSVIDSIKNHVIAHLQSKDILEVSNLQSKNVLEASHLSRPRALTAAPSIFPNLTKNSAPEPIIEDFKNGNQTLARLNLIPSTAKGSISCPKNVNMNSPAFKKAIKQALDRILEHATPTTKFTFNNELPSDIKKELQDYIASKQPLHNEAKKTTKLKKT